MAHRLLKNEADSRSTSNDVVKDAEQKIQALAFEENLRIEKIRDELKNKHTFCASKLFEPVYPITKKSETKVPGERNEKENSPNPFTCTEKNKNGASQKRKASNPLQQMATKKSKWNPFL